MTEKQLLAIDWADLNGRSFHPSPAAWEDQVLYFLMLDRFSDGNEKGFRDNDGAIVPGGKTEPVAPADNGNAVGTEAGAAQWREVGGVWNGETLRGLTSKLGSTVSPPAEPNGSPPKPCSGSPWSFWRDDRASHVGLQIHAGSRIAFRNIEFGEI